jgi:Xaa-Pro aminopeptidase
MSSRLARLRRELRRRGLHALLISSLPNIRYLTGFSGSNGLCVVTGRELVLVTDSRYALQSRMEARRCRRIISALGLLEAVAADGLLKRRQTVGFESHHLSYVQFRTLKRLFPRHRLAGEADMVEEIALTKDAAEVESLRNAARISGKVFADLLPLIRPGVREVDLAAEISYLQKRRGGERDAFEPIVASGENAVLPHARPTMKRIRNGETVILDFGTICNGYCSDLTRTVAVGKVSRRVREMYALVLDAHAAAVVAARGGIAARALDAVARDRLRGAGYGKFFTHSLGHGIGLSIHERPRVSPLSREILQTGSVITIEPGLYLPGVGGVRIEDDVVLTPNGCQLLTTAPRELLIL